MHHMYFKAPPVPVRRLNAFLSTPGSRTKEGALRPPDAFGLSQIAGLQKLSFFKLLGPDRIGCYARAREGFPPSVSKGAVWLQEATSPEAYAVGSVGPRVQDVSLRRPHWAFGQVTTYSESFLPFVRDPPQAFKASMRILHRSCFMPAKWYNWDQRSTRPQGTFKRSQQSGN